MYIKRKAYYYHRILVYYINEYILVIFDLSDRGTMCGAREQFAAFVRNTSFRASLPDLRSVHESWEAAVTERVAMFASEFL